MTIVHPDDSPALLETWANSQRTGEPYETKARFRCYDGAAGAERYYREIGVLK